MNLFCCSKFPITNKIISFAIFFSQTENKTCLFVVVVVVVVVNYVHLETEVHFISILTYLGPHTHIQTSIPFLY